jgi:uncharacterized glyoxalase superfamily protein PhnB
MPTFETYRKHAKLLQRWHAERNYSVGEKLRLLPRFRHLTDREILERPLPLTLAQEVVAAGAGFASWTDLKAAAAGTPPTPRPERGSARLKAITPILFVRDVPAAAAHYRDRMGFGIDFLHGEPAFYGAVSRDGVCLHLRLVCAPNFAALAATETSLILASIETAEVTALYDDLVARGADIVQKLARQPWGGTDFHVRDPDGNVISFVEYR